jgi:hypothetical protein
MSRQDDRYDFSDLFGVSEVAVPRPAAMTTTKGMHMRSLKMLLGAACLTALTTGVFANDADFRLNNKTGYQIDEVYVAPHSSKNWGKDIMGSDALEDGAAVNITFPHGGSACHFDIKVKYNVDDSTAEWSDINLCEYTAISLFWDAKNQVSRAVGE